MRKEIKSLETLAAMFTKNNNDEGMSSREIMAETGWGEDKTRAMLHQAQVAGKLVVGRRMAVALDGAKRPIPVYKVTT